MLVLHVQFMCWWGIGSEEVGKGGTVRGREREGGRWGSGEGKGGLRRRGEGEGGGGGLAKGRQEGRQECEGDCSKTKKGPGMLDLVSVAASTIITGLSCGWPEWLRFWPPETCRGLAHGWGGTGQDSWSERDSHAPAKREIIVLSLGSYTILKSVIWILYSNHLNNKTMVFSNVWYVHCAELWMHLTQTSH